jgi:hypothetical protein
MIGVIARPDEHAVVREFFELFKTPWEFHRSGRRYDVVLSAADGDIRGAAARLTLIYGGAPTPFDESAQIPISGRQTTAMLSYQGRQLPIYGSRLTFLGDGVLTDAASLQSAACTVPSDGGVVLRVGYDLFREIRVALTTGQPPAHAGIPAVEMHIALLRDLVIQHAPPLVEIPPVPAGHRFIACLTHDVDHASIRRHTWDHTILGFLYRAVVGSLINVCRRRTSLRSLLGNWLAVLKLPFVHAGLARDFWLDFDRYLELERGLPSTLFVIPFKNRPGRTDHGAAPRRRAARYEVADVVRHIHRFKSAGGDIGVHGIDAWRDSGRGLEERQQISRITGDTDIGIRMHWLYRDEQSPAILERAGFTYDSTIGYNETIGYRAGTGQAFKPFNAIRLLELPLHIMDTALFYPAHLDLSPAQAARRVRDILDNAERFGGTVTVNWHDRSIAPERLWGETYVDLVEEMRRRGAWFATASQAIAWFRRRRSVVFELVGDESGAVRARLSADSAQTLPALRLRVHTHEAGPEPDGAATVSRSEGWVDVGMDRGIDTPVGV